MIAVSFAVIAFAALSTCDLPPSFGDEYFDTGTNFIAAYPLSAPPVAGADTVLYPPGMPAAWDWAWRDTTGDTFEYMALTDEGTSGGASDGGFTLPASETSWRLELVNLMPDPAYFESLNDLDIPTGWEYVVATGVSIGITTGSRGKELLLVSEGTNWVGFNPNDIVNFFKTAPLPIARYSFFARTTTAAPLFNIAIASNTNFSGPADIIRTDILALKSFRIESVDHRVKFGKDNAGEQQTIRLDETRALRVDIDGLLRLRLLLRPGDTNPDLVPGYYEFSVWVRIPDDALLPSDDTGRTANPGAALAASKVKLAMTQLLFLDGSGTPSSKSGSFPVSANWSRLALQMESGSNFDRFDESTTEPVVELSIYPFSSNDTIDAGALLIAAPMLRFFGQSGY